MHEKGFSRASIPIALAVLISLAGFFSLVRRTPPPSPTQVPAGTVVVSAEDQVCRSDADCVRVGTDCSDCSCGKAIHRLHEQKYLKWYESICTDYSGPVCEFYCETPLARCINNRCVLTGDETAPHVEGYSPRRTTACSADQDCAEVDCSGLDPFCQDWYSFCQEGLCLCRPRECQ